MNQDLKIIKKKYGEAMMHLCRCIFSTILDNSPSVLPTILLDNFNPSHFLYDDITACFFDGEEGFVNDFKNYIYYLYDKLNIAKTNNYQYPLDPVTLMHQAGYTLYECLNEADIQSFKKYYIKREELCTFQGGRLNYCYVYFAVKEGADKLKRTDFVKPDRQDEYGTSVLSIQFTRDDNHTLSIKNRYNHTVANPDATFSNNLDNIVPGLTESFAKHYGMGQQHLSADFELPGYVRANDGKFYKYNFEIDNVYYCPGNIVIDNFQVIEYPHELYLVFDYFILDLVNKKITSKVNDSFPQTVGNITQIKITNNNVGKCLTISPESGDDIIINIDKYNQIISVINQNVKVIGDNFLVYNETIKSIIMNNVEHIGHNFLHVNTALEEIKLPNVLIIGDNFLQIALDIRQVTFPKLKLIGHNFMQGSRNLEKIQLPRVMKIGNGFLCCNKSLQIICLPKLRKVGNEFMVENGRLKTILLPEVINIGANFCRSGKKISKINILNVKEIGANFLYHNLSLTEIILPEVETISHHFMYQNECLMRVILPKVKTIGQKFMFNNYNVTEFYTPNLEPQDNINRHFQIVQNKVYQRLK